MNTEFIINNKNLHNIAKLTELCYNLAYHELHD
jgi:hypothetical protein